MEQRIGDAPGTEVARWLAPSLDVGEEKRGRPRHLPRGLLDAERRFEDGGGDHGERSHDGERGKQSPHASLVERPEADATGARELTEQERRDDKSRDDEEDVDPNESTGERQPSVEHDDHRDRDCPQTRMSARLETLGRGNSFSATGRSVDASTSSAAGGDSRLA
jgi:hypothetical protein